MCLEETMPKYSVVIPAYNSVETLAPLLRSLERQTFTDFETIVVDDASEDGTEEMVTQFTLTYERLEENCGPAAARNRGAELAKGEWLIFTDSDTEFMPGTVGELDRFVTGKTTDALVGSYSGRPANAGFVPRYKALWEYATIDLVSASDEEGFHPQETWAPRPGMVRKTAFEAVGGFDVRFRGADLEDTEFGYRLVEAGYRIYFDPTIRIRHRYPATIRAELRPFARRSALWMRMRRSRPRFDGTGEGSRNQAAAHVCGFIAFILLLGGMIAAPVLGGFAVAAGVYLGLNRRFLGLALREEGPVFAVKAAAYCWLHTITLGFAAAYGLLTPSRKL